MVNDPRTAKTLEEASKNPDGTYNGARMMSWLSEVLNPGKGIPEQEVMNMIKGIKERNKP